MPQSSEPPSSLQCKRAAKCRRATALRRLVGDALHSDTQVCPRLFFVCLFVRLKSHHRRVGTNPTPRSWDPLTPGSNLT